MRTHSSTYGGSVDSSEWTGERLDSWKEVASFFGREVRTVQLWEKSEGLPVRRQHHKKLGSVYAYRRELEAWWAARSAVHVSSGERAAGWREKSTRTSASASASSNPRVLVGPLEAIHSPLDRGPLRQIVERFADGLKNDMVLELLRSHFSPVILPMNELPVIGMPTLDRLRNMTRDLGTELLLTGSIRYSGNQARVSIQLVRASDLLCLWSERFECALDNILDAQTHLAHRIVSSMPKLDSPALATHEKNLVITRGIAFHACTMGFHYWQSRGRPALMKALTYFKDAIELEPKCADAYAGLADTYVSLSYNHMMPPHRAAQEAREAVARALELQPTSVTVRNAHINLLIHCDWDLDAAEERCRKTLDAGVTDARTIQLYSSLMNVRGRHQEAINLALHAYRRDPDSDLINGQVALAYFYAGDYGSALSFVRRTIDLQPQYLMGYALLGRTESVLANWDAAIDAFQRGLQVSPRCLFMRALLAYAYAGSGDAERSREILADIEGESADECYPAYDVSAVHAMLKQENEALHNMHRAYGMRDMKTIFVQHDPRFTSLHRTSHFQQIASAIHMGAHGTSASNVA